MFRIATTTLVLAGWLLSQLATAPHIHGDGREHSSRPHVHLGHHSHGANHSHPHVHREPTRPVRPVIANAHPEHDGDAIFFPSQDSTPSASSVKSLGLDSLAPALGIEGKVANVEDSLRLGRAEPLWQALAPEPPRFLILRTLRI